MTRSVVHYLTNDFTLKSDGNLRLTCNMNIVADIEKDKKRMQEVINDRQSAIYIHTR